MGFGTSDAAKQAEKQMNEQIAQNNAQKEQMRKDLYSSRLDIIKGQGEQTWVPDKNESIDT